MPDILLAVITGGGGFTVMVNVTGVPAQFVPALKKFPNEKGLLTGIVDVTVLVAAFITDTVFVPTLVT